jgi:hypothetical protein
VCFPFQGTVERINVKTLEAPKVPAPIEPTADPFDSYEKAAQAVSKMMKPPKPAASTSKGKARLIERIRTPPFCPSPDLEHFENYEQSGFDWAAERMYDLEVYRKGSQEPPVSLRDSGSIHDPEYNFDESDDDEDAPRQLTFIDRRMDVNDDIVDAAGLEKPRERQVPLSRNKLLLTTPQCIMRSTSVQETKEPLGSDVEISDLKSLVNSLNKIELHTQKCEKCKHTAYNQKAWILDSGASQHFTSTKEDYIDFEVISNAHEVKTASAKATLRVEGKGTILLSHLIENHGT